MNKCTLKILRLSIARRSKRTFYITIALRPSAPFLGASQTKGRPCYNTHSVTRPAWGRKTSACSGDKGLRTWRDLLWSEQVPLTPHKADALIDTARRSTHHLSERDPHFFYENLPAREHWRLFAEFRDDTAYFDIETTGLGGPEDHITTIVLYDGQLLRHYVHGTNMDQFADDVARYKVLVSYNGKSFDAPFVRRCLRAP